MKIATEKDMVFGLRWYERKLLFLEDILEERFKRFGP